MPKNSIFKSKFEQLKQFLSFLFTINIYFLNKKFKISFNVIHLTLKIKKLDIDAYTQYDLRITSCGGQFFIGAKFYLHHGSHLGVKLYFIVVSVIFGLTEYIFVRINVKNRFLKFHTVFSKDHCLYFV